MILGFVGNLLFAMRFIVQWIASEKRGESVLPVSFWHFSIAGSMILGAYFIFAGTRWELSAHFQIP